MRIFIHQWQLSTSMPPTIEDQTQRRAAIRDLLLRGPAETQASLVSALQDLGHGAVLDARRMADLVDGLGEVELS